MMMVTIRINALADLRKAAHSFINSMGEHRVFAFEGEMGAGKTTFIKSICQELGVVENITSPTFALINEYITPNGQLIYHFDCYRLKNIQEAFDFGAEEYFYSGNFCFIEWPDRIQSLLPDDTIFVKIDVLPNNQREVLVMSK
jgi:tRNA threonylcarbamoyladenosine biosynthesis protein TsaE